MEYQWLLILTTDYTSIQAKQRTLEDKASVAKTTCTTIVKAYQERGGHWGVPNTAENIDKYRNTAKKIGKYRNTASKVDEIPKSQKRGILFTLCSPADKNCVV